MDEGVEPRGRGAVRLIFEFAERGLRMLSNEPVDVLVPPTDRLDGYEDHLGVWVEVCDVDGRALHRRVLPSDLGETVEVFGDASGPSLRRAPVSRARGSFAVLVPDLEQADHLSFMSGLGAAAVRAEGATATELARFPLGRGGAS
ncbi:hypothetical protein [Umezawaea tangerina]|uniref:Uncharacterized protein n=1 Tax=Umezawaea tangerina TaxID=84725 RepID=A0A2T0TH26_9PSEU|nr:hypothetical protein [Umezawaea tangerina]PRY44994.1 hypothetical protein CLV43_102559 [Umezawaea tangerina]